MVKMKIITYENKPIRIEILLAMCKECWEKHKHLLYLIFFQNESYRCGMHKCYFCGNDTIRASAGYLPYFEINEINELNKVFVEDIINNVKKS